MTGSLEWERSLTSLSWHKARFDFPGKRMLPIVSYGEFPSIRRQGSAWGRRDAKGTAGHHDSVLVRYITQSTRSKPTFSTSGVLEISFSLGSSLTNNRGPPLLFNPTVIVPMPARHSDVLPTV